jgi:hypothetical protein
VLWVVGLQAMGGKCPSSSSGGIFVKLLAMTVDFFQHFDSAMTVP